MNQETDTKTDILLYSQASIAIATFFGGPLAAGILVRRNFINLGNEQAGKHAVVIGIIFTILILGGVFLIPEPVLDMIPNVLIPSIYTAIIYFIVEKYQGAELKAHKTNNYPFYSAWKAAGAGLISLLIIAGVIVGGVFLMPDDFDVAQYDDKIIRFEINEERASEVFFIIETNDTAEIISHIDNVVLPAWNENLKLVDELDSIEGLYEVFKQQNQIIRQYSATQIECFELIKKAFIEDTDKYDEQIYSLNDRIEELLNQLQ